jgi:hypothetical protein
MTSRIARPLFPSGRKLGSLSGPSTTAFPFRETVSSRLFLCLSRRALVGVITDRFGEAILDVACGSLIRTTTRLEEQRDDPPDFGLRKNRSLVDLAYVRQGEKEREKERGFVIAPKRVHERSANRRKD